MTVSRKGKYGNRAGGKTHRPTSRNGRVRLNARLAATTKNDDDRPCRNRTSREEWVIHLVAAELGTRASYVEADDVASDIIFELLDCGGFSWEEDEIKDFCRRKIGGMVRKMTAHRHGHAKIVRECDIKLGGEFQDGHSILESLLGSVSANQEKVVDAKIWISRLKNIPGAQRLALEILCGGGNPIDVAKEMGVEPWAAIALIKEGRRFIHMVDGEDELGAALRWAA